MGGDCVSLNRKEKIQGHGDLYKAGGQQPPTGDTAPWKSEASPLRRSPQTRVAHAGGSQNSCDSEGQGRPRDQPPWGVCTTPAWRGVERRGLAAQGLAAGEGPGTCMQDSCRSMHSLSGKCQEHPRCQPASTRATAGPPVGHAHWM